MQKLPAGKRADPARPDSTFADQVSHRTEYHLPQRATFGHVAVLTQGVGSFSGNGGTMRMMAAMTMMTMSDVRSKQNLMKVGQQPRGFGLYCCEYKSGFTHLHGAGRQFGVLAREVEKVVPAAVKRGRDGYRRVNYPLPGIRQAAGVEHGSQRG